MILMNKNVSVEVEYNCAVRWNIWIRNWLRIDYNYVNIVQPSLMEQYGPPLPRIYVVLSCLIGCEYGDKLTGCSVIQAGHCYSPFVAGVCCGWCGAFFTGHSGKDGSHDDVIKWKHFPPYNPFVRGIHRSPVNSPHKSQWRGALMVSLICAWINCWVNNHELVIWDAIALIMTSL